MKYVLAQKDYKVFQKKVALLKSKGVELDFTVSKPNHKRVGIRFNKQYDFNELDRKSEE